MAAAPRAERVSSACHRKACFSEGDTQASQGRSCAPRSQTVGARRGGAGRAAQTPASRARAASGRHLQGWCGAARVGCGAVSQGAPGGRGGRQRLCNRACCGLHVLPACRLYCCRPCPAQAAPLPRPRRTPAKDRHGDELGGRPGVVQEQRPDHLIRLDIQVAQGLAAVCEEASWVEARGGRGGGGAEERGGGTGGGGGGGGRGRVGATKGGAQVTQGGNRYLSSSCVSFRWRTTQGLVTSAGMSDRGCGSRRCARGGHHWQVQEAFTLPPRSLHAAPSPCTLVIRGAHAAVCQGNHDVQRGHHLLCVGGGLA